MAIKIATLDDKAASLTIALRGAGMLSNEARIVRDSAYGGHRFVVTGGPSLPNGSISSGQFGLDTAYKRTGLAYENADHVLRAVMDFKYRTNPPRY